MSYPYDVRIDALGNRFVCEFGNSRVQIFDPHNQPLEILGGPGADPGQMNNPWAIAFNSRGDLYVADALNHRVQKFIRRVPFSPAQTGVHKKPDATKPARPIAAK
jgi:DNA-binding beta-propeller fold protein YncE